MADTQRNPDLTTNAPGASRPADKPRRPLVLQHEQGNHDQDKVDRLNAATAVVKWRHA